MALYELDKREYTIHRNLQKEEIMAQKKKKGPAPKNKNVVKRKKLSFSQIMFYTLGVIVVLSMVIGTLRF